MKKFIFSLLSVIFAMTAQAQLAAGDYVIQNVETGYFLGGGNDWGTHASLLRNPQIFTFAGSDNVFTLDSHQSNGGDSHYLGTGLYVDAASAQWTFTATSTDGVYTILNDGKYLAGNGINQVIKTVTDGTDTDAQWKVISTQTLSANMANATLDNPQNVTFLIGNHEFKRNAGVWTVTSFDGSANAKNFNYGSGGNNANCSESYHSSNGFKATQTITGLPVGVYQLDAQAFYRQDGSDDKKPYFSMNGSRSEFPVRTGDENNMAAAYQSFLQGKYPITPLIVRVEENGSIALEVAGESTSMWNIFGELNLTYYGSEADINAVKNLALYAQVQELLAEAETLAEAKMDAAAKSNLIEIVKDENQPTLTTEEDYNAYIAKLIETINNAKNSINIYANALRLYNVYNGYANDANASIDDFMPAYEAGTLPEDPATEIRNMYYAALDALKVGTKNVTATYINNGGLDANVEGWTITDGTLHKAGNKNFGMMSGEDFVEYWQNSATGLPNAEMTQIVTLPAGKYILTAEAQNLQQNNSSVEPGGFFLFGPEGQTEITNVAATVATTFTLTEKTEVTIGVKLLGCTGNWVCVDNFQLFQVIDVPTAIGEVAANGMKDGKFVKNNRIVIVRNGKAYNAAGARIQK